MFEYDVFLSYSHIDNQPLASDQEGWVTSLHTALDVRLSQLLGRSATIWRDGKLQGNDLFDEEITARFSNAATLVSIMSPRYVKSEWCIKELTTYIGVAEGSDGPEVGTKSRVFKVAKTPVTLAEQPAQVQRVLGYDFFSIDPQTDRASEFNLFSGSKDLERLYWGKLEDLAQDLARRLREMETIESASPDTTPDQASSSPEKTIFLAETSSDLTDERDAVRRDLVQHGYSVLPNERLPYVAQDFNTIVENRLSESSMSIHLIGRTYGLVPDGTTKSTVHLQTELALGQAADRADFQRLIWMPDTAEIEDERQRRLLDSIRTESMVGANVDILESGLEDFKATIHKTIAARKQSRSGSEPEDEAPASGAKHVYLICDELDTDEATTLRDHLFDRGLEVTMPLFKGEAGDVREDHEDNLKSCEAVLIYYGEATEAWLRKKLRELKKILGYGRTQPWLAKAILMAGPGSPEKQSFRTHEALVLPCYEKFTPSVLAPFLDALKG